MIYYVINNDFHIENIINNINLSNESDFTLIRIPHNLNNDCRGFAKNILTIKTPFRVSKEFWNPIRIFRAKKQLEEIHFSKEDKVILLTEYEPLNQYAAYLAYNKGAEIQLLEEGVSFYGIYLFNNPITSRFKYLVKLFYIRHIIGFHFFKYIDVGSQTYPQMEDKYINKMLLYFSVKSSRNIEIEIIQHHTKSFNNLDKNSVVFLSQPLYDYWTSLEHYIEIVITQLRQLSDTFPKVYFKFHPRDNLVFKKKIKDSVLTNIHFIENQTLDNFFIEYKPFKAFSFFSDSLFKLKLKGVEVKFLFSQVPELAEQRYFLNLAKIVKRLENG